MIVRDHRHLTDAPGWLGGLVGGLAPDRCAGWFGGLVLGLRVGGWYLLLQYLARRRAAQQDLLPRHPIDFLEDACRVGLMRRVGSGYQFRPGEIRKHLVREAPLPGLVEIRRRTTPTHSASATPAAVYAEVEE